MDRTPQGRRADIGGHSRDQNGAKSLADSSRVLATARRTAEKTDEEEYVRVRGLLGPELRLKREEA